MKHSYLFIIIILLGGCKASTNEEELPLLDGNWVLKEFVENIETTKSLKGAYELSDFYCTEMIFDSQKDSVIVFNGQEGYSTLPITSDNRRKLVSFRPNTPAELFFDRKDSSLFFADSTLNRVFRYKRALQSQLDTTLDIPLAMPYLINERLMVGNWQDDYENLIKFDPLGKVIDWNLYDSYMVFYNPSLVSNESGDLLLLKSGTATEHLYGMTLDGKEIILYDLKPSDDSTKYKHGEVKYRFTLLSAPQ